MVKADSGVGVVVAALIAIVTVDAARGVAQENASATTVESAAPVGSEGGGEPAASPGMAGTGPIEGAATAGPASDVPPPTGAEAPPPATDPAPAAAEAPPPVASEAALADDPSSRSRRIDEIVVTAQKTEQPLHDVPIALSVLDDEFLNEQSLTDFGELSKYVPNVLVLPAAFSPRATMRGFGVDEQSGSNKGLESPISVVVDGVSYGNKFYLQTGFFDLDRVEVLRGPQNTLFGKNNSVGLFNITTRKPTDEYTGYFDAEIGEPERRRFEGAVGGPVVPGWLNMRVAAVMDERDGFSTNTAARTNPGALENQIAPDRKAFRVKGQLPDVFGAEINLSYEHWELEVEGVGFEFVTVPQEMRDFFRQFDPDVEFDYGNFKQSNDHPSRAENEADTFVANASYEVGNWGLDLVLGHSILDADNSVDADLTPAPALRAFSKDSNADSTFELRATSPDLPGFFGLEGLFGYGLGKTNFTGGLFYQRRRVTDSEFTIKIDTLLAGTFALVGMGVPIPPATFPVIAGAAGQAVEETTMFWEAGFDTLAGYGQMDWEFLERWTLGAGLRLAHEWRDADWRRVFAGSVPIFLQQGSFEEFTASRDDTELRLAPRVNLRHDLTDEINLFATYSTGYRGGGFNENANQETSLEFDTETVTNYEIGTNFTGLGDTALVNLVLFHMTVDDFQLLTVDPNTLFNEIVNTGEARARGVELDATYLPLDWLGLRATVGFNDTEFVDFPLGPCVTDRPNTDGDGDARCDLSGRDILRAPPWSITFVPSVRYPLEDVPGIGTALPAQLAGIDLLGSFTVEYRDSYLTDPTLDPRTRQDSYFRFDGSLGFDNTAQGWSVRVTAFNLSDELISQTVRQVQLLGRHFTASPAPPRHVFGEFRWSF